MNWKNSILGFILVGLTIGLGYFTQQADFSKIALFYLPFFGIYLYLLKTVENQKSVHFFLGIALLLRFLLVFSYPNLSDDLYRFAWDGRLLINGYNPFDHLPSYYIEQKITIPGITPELFSQLNSPDYFTIYPPVAQLTFASAVWLFPDSIYGSSVMMKLYLFLFELGTILLLVRFIQRFDFPPKNALIYALNPLIIVEICGNLHFEGAMIFFFLGGIYLLNWRINRTESSFPERSNFIKPQKLIASAIVFAFSIASKLLPLIFLPFLIKRLGWKKSFLYFSVIGMTLILLFSPLINSVFLENFGNSLNLYFQKFEFNASLYYIARWVGYQQIGWNMIAIIGPALALCTPILIFGMAIWEKGSKNIFLFCLFAITTYLLFTTTVHPWYIALPLVLCVFTSFRFPVLWSGFIFLTYINYSYPVYQENLWIVGMEYLSVGLFLIYELFFAAKFRSVRYLRV